MASNNLSSRDAVKVGGSLIKAATDISSVTSPKWQTIVSTFIAGQDVKQSSRDLYSRTLLQFFVWVETSEKDLSRMTRRDILEYKDGLLSSGKSNLTVSSYIVIVRKFYEWAESCKIYPNIAKGVKTPPKKQSFKKQHLSDAKSAELITTAGTRQVSHRIRANKSNPEGDFKTEDSITNKRDEAIVNLMLRTGLRTIEVVRANISDITFKNEKRVLMVWGKGKDSKDDFVVLTDKAWLPIKEYLEERGASSMNEPLFVSASDRNKGGRLTTRTISGICKRSLVEIGLDGREYTAHSLRHTTAVGILKHGGSITDVQDVLRHSSPVTSQIYTESIKEEMRLQKSPESMLDDAF